MELQKKMEQAQDLFNLLADILSDTHVLVESCNQDASAYLVPLGTEDQITYYSKPKNSYRISDHWNWYSNTRKCHDVSYIQCYSEDIPFPRKRERPGKASLPRNGIQVAYFGDDGKYHCIFGDKYDRKTNAWTWVGLNPVA